MTIQRRNNVHRCHLCGAEKFPGELEHDGRGFITCVDALECLIRAGHQELAYQEAKQTRQEGAAKLPETSAAQWERMKRNAKR